MRRQVLDYCGGLFSLHEVQVRLLAWLDTHYHLAPHAGLMGRAPSSVYLPEAREIERVDEAVLKRALTVTPLSTWAPMLCTVKRTPLR